MVRGKAGADAKGAVCGLADVRNNGRHYGTPGNAGNTPRINVPHPRCVQQALRPRIRRIRNGGQRKRCNRKRAGFW
ncbi:hypothetical protein JCM16814_24540 [Desulfobaculum senezii]